MNQKDMKYLNKYAWGLALALCGMLLVSTAQAQSENYGIYRNSDNGAFRTGGTAANTTFTAIKDASLTFTIEQSVEDRPFSLLDPSTWFNPGSQPSNSPIALGVYTYGFDADGNIEIRDSTIFTDLKAGDTVSTAGVLDIKAGEMVGMYVQRQTAGLNGIQTSYLTPGSGVGGLPSSTVQKAQYAQSGTDGLGYFEMDNSWPGNPDLNIDVLVKIVGAAPAAPASSGAPLPGVLATVTLTTLAGGYLKRRRKPVSVETEE